MKTRKRWVKSIIALTMALILCFGLIPYGKLGGVFAAGENPSLLLEDTDFTGNLWDDHVWTITPSTWDNAEFKYFTYADDTWLIPDAECGTTSFKFWMGEGNFTLTQEVENLPAGTYTLSSLAMGADAKVRLFLGDETGRELTELGGYNTWSSCRKLLSSTRI